MDLDPTVAAVARACRECGAPLAADQRYCLTCGARAGERSVAVKRLMLNAGESWRTPSDPAAGALVAAAAAGRAPTPALLSPKLSAALVAAFLGFGTLMGLAAGSGVERTLAADAGARLRLVIPSGAGAPPPPSASESTPSAEASGSSSESVAAPAPAASSSTEAAAPSSSGESSSEGEGAPSRSSAPAPATKLPPIKHVFVIMLSNEPYAAVFGPASSARFLTGTLEHQGELLVRYDSVAHAQLADGIALISGQGPTGETAANCPTYSDIAPAGTGPSEQVLGGGCVYPAATPTLAGQLAAKHRSWRAYVQGSDEAPATAGACAHPAIGQPDPSVGPQAAGPYATFRNPFLYFHSIIDSPACARSDVGLAALNRDLAAPARTPSFSYIAPDLCHDGDPTPCAAGAQAGMGPADSFLSKLVPEITRSRAYREGGLIVITVDEAPSSGEFADSSGCCGQPRFPNIPAGEGGRSPRGGGAVGALLLSPYVKGGTTSQEPFNHFSLLRTIEDLFKLGHIGYAGLSAVKPLQPAMFTAKPSR